MFVMLISATELATEKVFPTLIIAYSLYRLETPFEIELGWGRFGQEGGIWEKALRPWAAILAQYRN